MQDGGGRNLHQAETPWRNGAAHRQVRGMVTFAVPRLPTPDHGVGSPGLWRSSRIEQIMNLGRGERYAALKGTAGATSMNAPVKIAPKSNLFEWRRLDRINLVGNEMRSIWREQEKDRVGIDGEIERCRPRAGEDGAEATGRILKIQ
ncbi:DUF4365 domain-containing protein [Methylobacterium sp. E-045]|uniref:DUF4365 domain-containing protein n=1 Tax=Methylobacterium sp. E-045 TaxID=2836575 RepID=UPI001FB8DD8D|nr:DUF4365 domain-containing protein [Methylobacterium sp. E-045]MCJ2132153.1 DUF4365 domain-containing protein [Methylobacterium sp. E-045]